MDKTILLVEDEAIIALSETRILEKSGYSVINAYSGEDAIQISDTTPEIDLVLMDINLGDGISGTEAAKRILNNHDIPIVFLSSHTEPSIVESTEGITSYGYIVKNSGETVLNASIKMAFRLFAEKQKVRKHGQELSVANEELVVANEQLEKSKSDLLKRERELILSEKKLKEAHELAQMGYWYWDVTTGKVEWSCEVFSIFGLDPKSFVPRIDSIMALSPWPEENKRNEELIQKATENHEKGYYEQRFLLPDGNVGYYQSTFHGIYNESGILTAIQGTIQDITTRKRYELSLAEREEQFRILFDNAADAIFVSDTDGKIVQINEKACNLTGYSKEELLSLNVTDIDTELASEESFEKVLSVISSGASMRRNSCHRKKDGSTYPVEITISLFESIKGTRVLGLAREILQRE